ncbi:MAG TPA: DUF6178 family protein [Candidatus Binataceae bacterium]|nr:DUF6178 family protein [Candidatus Binataceae bacterium]
MASNRQSEFLNLPFKEKLEFLYGLPARQKRDLILSAPEAERLVQSFSPETLFYTLKEIGSADAGDLLSLALPEQVKSLFDLDCWDKDRPNLDRMREWIEALTEGGRRRLADALMELDLELVSILLRSYIKVHRVDDPNIAGDAPANRLIQFDEHYLIEFVRYDQITQPLTEFLEEVFERDYRYYAGLMEESYWGVEAELEEEAYQFRRARLEDRGFPEYFEAQSVFAYLDPTKFDDLRRGHVTPSREGLLADEEILPPDMALATERENSLFNAALAAGFAADGQRQLRSEMAMVTNQVLVARSVDYGDPEAVHVAVEMTHNYLNLALEHLASGDLRAAVENLRDTHLKLLFRLGVSLTIDLRTRAQAVVTRLGLDFRKTREIGYLDSPYREAIAGLMLRQPRFYAALDQGGSIAMRDFRAMRDLHVGYAMVDQIEAMIDLFRSLFNANIASASFRSSVAGHEIRLSQIVLTALGREALDQRFAPDPIEASRLSELHRKIMTPGGRPAKLSDGFHSDVDAILESKLDDGVRSRSAAFINSCLNIIEEEFAELDPRERIDPRYIRSVLLKRG